MSSGVDVLGVIELQQYRFRAARLTRELRDCADRELREARATVAELIEAADAYFRGYCQDEADDTFEANDTRGDCTGCSREQAHAAARLREAIALAKGGAS
ncbi:hypothetical protein LJR143_002218 [Pseudoxanthomonas sp. LjRoot143]|uniref:hypothetical protein n=1 Tax=Pseudoxanthomonas sp. LjRoot143 TaxID=3342266 RepID=UPI003ECEF7C7